jgi:hypothetical protein
MRIAFLFRPYADCSSKDRSRIHALPLVKRGETTAFGKLDDGNAIELWNGSTQDEYWGGPAGSHPMDSDRVRSFKKGDLQLDCT